MGSCLPGIHGCFVYARATGSPSLHLAERTTPPAQSITNDPFFASVDQSCCDQVANPFDERFFQKSGCLFPPLSENKARNSPFGKFPYPKSRLHMSPVIMFPPPSPAARAIPVPCVRWTFSSGLFPSFPVEGFVFAGLSFLSLKELRLWIVRRTFCDSLGRFFGRVSFWSSNLPAFEQRSLHDLDSQPCISLMGR